MKLDNVDEATLLELAWGIIANAGWGDWTKESVEWRGAAVRWRDQYHAYLAAYREQATEMAQAHQDLRAQLADCRAALREAVAALREMRSRGVSIAASLVRIIGPDDVPARFGEVIYREPVVEQALALRREVDALAPMVARAAGPTPPATLAAACDCRAAVEGLLHTIRNEDRRPSESYCAALEDVVAMLTTGAAPFTCPHCRFVYYDERQRIVCNNCGEPPSGGGGDAGDGR